MSLRSVEQEWQEFRTKVMPKDAPRVQIEEMKKAFFAGAFSMLCSCRRIGEPDISEEQGINYLDAVYEECMAFSRKQLADWMETN